MEATITVVLHNDSRYNLFFPLNSNRRMVDFFTRLTLLVDTTISVLWTYLPIHTLIYIHAVSRNNTHTADGRPPARRISASG